MIWISLVRTITGNSNCKYNQIAELQQQVELHSSRRDSKTDLKNDSPDESNVCDNFSSSRSQIVSFSAQTSELSRHCSDKSTQVRTLLVVPYHNFTSLQCIN